MCSSWQTTVSDYHKRGVLCTATEPMQFRKPHNTGVLH
jgi:hypothetical protein